jgi:Terminase large subunit, T4likevirus-type, N-terminal
MPQAQVDFNLVKRANAKTSYTPHQIREIARCSADPLYFMENYLKIQHPVKGQIKFEAYAYQKKLVEAYWKNNSIIALLPRQSGKTTTAAGYLLWYAMFTDDVTILIAANKFRAANEIMDRIKYAYEELPDWLRAGVQTYNVQDVKFDNGSRIKATTTTPDSGRGMSISLLYLDEFAFVKPRIAEEFWTAMAPTLATGGKCIITSTPNSDEDKFAEIWFGANKTIDDYGNDTPDGLGVNGFKGFTAHYSEVPGRDDVWATKERAKIGADKFDREYDCKFLTADETLINAVTLLQLQGQDPIYKTNEVRWYDKIQPNKTYLVALDPSAGVGKDPAAIQIYCLPDMKQVGEWTHNRTSIPNQVRTMQNIINFIHTEMKKSGSQQSEPDIYFTIENNSWGEAALQTINDIGEDRFNAIMMHEPRIRGVARYRKGLNTNGRTKAMACSKLKSLIENKKLTVSSRMLVRQLKFFVSKGDSFAAKSGENDDCVMSTLLCIRMMQMVTSWDESVGTLLRDDFGDEHHEDPMPITFGF